MRFLHTADWHIGRRLHGFDLSAEQEDAFQQIEQIALDEQVDGMIIAGDLYDRSLPAETSVAQLDRMLQRLNLTDHLPLYAVAGNHDSATRLATGNPWYQSTNFYLATKLEEAFTPVELPDTQIFLLPYFEPFAAQQYFNDEMLIHLDQAMVPVVEQMKAQFNPQKKQILVAHFFVAGSAKTDSETQLTVGGLASVPAALLKDFDYVALGHLHGKDALHEPHMRYSGSPIKFSLSEAQQSKGVWIIDTDPFQLTFKPLKPLRDVQQITAHFDDLIDPTFYAQFNRENYFGFILQDRKPILNALPRLREIYPNVVSLSREEGYSTAVESQGMSGKQIRQKDPVALLGDFYESVAKEALTAQQMSWAKETLKIANDGGTKS